jgi:type VI protein secretion system component Hcp
VTPGEPAGPWPDRPFSVVLPAGFATPRLFQACATGKEFPAATLLVRTAGGGPQLTTQRYDFKLVAAQSLAVSASGKTTRRASASATAR